MTVTILGISAYHHNSSAALISDGKIIAAAQEERFTRKKGDPSFPSNAIKYCLEQANTYLSAIDYITFYDKPLLKFDRLLETYLAAAPRGTTSFLKAIPIWMREKLNLKNELTKQLLQLTDNKSSLHPKLLFTLHHQSHAAAAFFPSPHEEAAILCIDGVGEWATTTAWYGKSNKLIPQWEICFPHSLGLLYSAFAYYAGFKVNFSEYKLMRLAAYGKPIYKNLILEKIIDLKSDGTFRLNMRYFDYFVGKRIINKKFEQLFDHKARSPETEITSFHMDIASSIQAVAEEVIMRLSHNIADELNCDTLCLSGSLALNCVANGKLHRQGRFKQIWIQPSPDDAGSAIGAALSAWYEYLNKPRQPQEEQSAYLGPEFSNQEIQQQLNKLNAVYSTVNDKQLIATTAKHLEQERMVGWFQGRMEFGPLALGNRSILGDPRNINMQKTMSKKIKFRGSFCPFSTAILEDKAGDYFEITKSPYSLFVSMLKQNKRGRLTDTETESYEIGKLEIKKSNIPTRIQTVNRQQNHLYYDLIKTFYELTNCPVLINAPFNVSGEPIVCTPIDAYSCFMRTNMDILVIGNQILFKNEQPRKNAKLYSTEQILLD